MTPLLDSDNLHRLPFSLQTPIQFSLVHRLVSLALSDFWLRLMIRSDLSNCLYAVSPSQGTTFCIPLLLFRSSGNLA